MLFYLFSSDLHKFYYSIFVLIFLRVVWWQEAATQKNEDQNDWSLSWSNKELMHSFCDFFASTLECMIRVYNHFLQHVDIFKQVGNKFKINQTHNKPDDLRHAPWEMWMRAFWELYFSTSVVRPICIKCNNGNMQKQDISKAHSAQMFRNNSHAFDIYFSCKPMQEREELYQNSQF